MIDEIEAEAHTFLQGNESIATGQIQQILLDFYKEADLELFLDGFDDEQVYQQIELGLTHEVLQTKAGLKIYSKVLFNLFLSLYRTILSFLSRKISTSLETSKIVRAILKTKLKMKMKSRKKKMMKVRVNWKSQMPKRQSLKRAVISKNLMRMSTTMKN